MSEDSDQQPPPPPPPYPPYQQPQPYQQPYQQVGGQPGMPQFPVYVLPDHPTATSALVVGIIAVAGTFVCGLPILASPVAWVLGAQSRREIRNAPQQWGGEGKATAGMVLGIIGTVLLVLVILAIVLLVVLIANDSNAFDGNTSV
jgi:hypothetical protein